MTRPTWEECRAANMSCREAAEARGVGYGSALFAAKKGGWKWRDIRREASRARMTARNKSPACRAASSERLIDLHQDPTFREANSARSRAKMIVMNADPAFRAASSARLQAMHQDPVFRAARSAMMSERNQDPVFKAAQAERGRACMTAMNNDPAFNPLVLLTLSERVFYDALIRKSGSTRAQVLAFIGRADLVRGGMK